MPLTARATLGALATLLFVTPTASAAPYTPSAPRAGGRLDFTHIAGRKPTNSGPLKITLRFAQHVPAGVLRRGSGNSLRVLFDTDGDRRPEFVGRVVARGRGRLGLRLRSRSGHQHYETLTVVRPGGRSLRTTIPGGAPMNPNGDLWIRAVSGFRGVGCAQRCRDAIPGHGWLHLRET